VIAPTGLGRGALVAILEEDDLGQSGLRVCSLWYALQTAVLFRTVRIHQHTLQDGPALSYYRDVVRCMLGGRCAQLSVCAAPICRWYE
jgi:hypothetical protein